MQQGKQQEQKRLPSSEELQKQEQDVGRTGLVQKAFVPTMESAHTERISDAGLPQQQQQQGTQAAFVASQDDHVDAGAQRAKTRRTLPEPTPEILATAKKVPPPSSSSRRSGKEASQSESQAHTEEGVREAMPAGITQQQAPSYSSSSTDYHDVDLDYEQQHIHTTHTTSGTTHTATHTQQQPLQKGSRNSSTAAVAEVIVAAVGGSQLQPQFQAGHY